LSGLRHAPGEPRELVSPGNARFLLSGSKPQRLAAEQSVPYSLLRARNRFVHFELLRTIGRGGFAKVYEALNRRSGRRVALKVLEFRPLESRAHAFRRLLREVPLASSLNHPCIVPVYDVGLGEGVPYVEMELMSGGSLAELVARKGPVPWPEACGYLLQALSALDASHAAGIVHRDVKPSNILLDAAGRARLGDFGLCKLVRETTSLTPPGAVLGSPHFMAPEQWTGGQVGPWTDVYASALVAYFLLTGRRPFEGQDALSLLYSHLHVPLPDPRALVPDIPLVLVQAVRKGAAKGREERFRSAGEFAAAVREVSGGVAGA